MVNILSFHIIDIFLMNFAIIILFLPTSLPHTHDPRHLATLYSTRGRQASINGLLIPTMSKGQFRVASCFHHVSRQTNDLTKLFTVDHACLFLFNFEGFSLVDCCFFSKYSRFL